MKTDSFIRNVLYGDDRSIGASLIRLFLTPLAWLHQLGLEAYLLPFRLGIRTRFRLPAPVIAIGNLSSGGTGKTPMAALLADWLKAQGWRVALLSRGHGGSNESGSSARIVSDGNKVLLTPAEAGDEPVLLANLLPGVPVVVCRDRRVSGRLAVERFAPDVIILDDALQYWQLHRDLDIVLLDARRPFDNGFVLPRGLLREPPSHLARAGIAVLTRADRVPAEHLSRTIADVQRYGPKTRIFTASHAPISWVRASDGTALPLTELAGGRALAFSGIADGEAFLQTVRNLGVALTEVRDFGDHHPYSAQEVLALNQAAIASGATVAITTEKDLTKVSALWPADGLPLFAVRIGMRMDTEGAFFAEVMRYVKTSSRAGAVGKSGN